MKKKTTLLMFLLLLALTGCGGGGGGSNDAAVVAAKTITLFDTGTVTLSLPKLMAFSGNGLLTVAVQGVPGRVDTFDVSSGNRVSTLRVDDPFGVAVKPGTNDVYYTGGTSGNQGVFSNGVQVPIPNTSANLYGIAYTTAQDWYVANVAGSILIYRNNVQGNPVSVPVPTGLPSALIANNDLIYVSLAGPAASILSFNPANSSAPGNGFTVLPWGTFDFPNGMAIDGEYAYIANGGLNGNNGYISRVKISDPSDNEVFASSSVGIWRTSGVGFCNPSGLAIYDKYLYVSNGTCANSINQNQILKIKLP